jgi:hypothetical protein
MSQPQPAQPNQPQYPLSTLDLFPVYASRAAYQQATTNQAPPFDPTRPPQYWEDLSQAGKTGTVTYLIVNTANAATDYLGQLTITAAAAASVNLPGVYTYPPYVSAPTDAIEVGPFGTVGAASPNTVCLQASAQAVANAIAPLFPGLTPTVAQQTTGVYYYTYGVDPRRVWYVQVGTQSFIAQALIEAQNSHGVGYPGSFQLQNGAVNWVAGTPVTQPPATQASVATPIRQLLPNEEIVQVPPSNPLFGQPTFVVGRTDLPQPTVPETDAQQFADLKAMLTAIQTALSTLAAK